MDVPPMSISERALWRLASSKGNFAAQRTDSITLIIRIHDGDCEEGRYCRKCWAASMRLLHSATLIFRSISPPGSSWGSFGGMKTCSITERKMLESGSLVVGADMTCRE